MGVKEVSWMFLGILKAFSLNELFFVSGGFRQRILWGFRVFHRGSRGSRGILKGFQNGPRYHNTSEAHYAPFRTFVSS